jgi:hypothetical protein
VSALDGLLDALDGLLDDAAAAGGLRSAQHTRLSLLLSRAAYLPVIDSSLNSRLLNSLDALDNRRANSHPRHASNTCAQRHGMRKRTEAS